MSSIPCVASHALACNTGALSPAHGVRRTHVFVNVASLARCRARTPTRLRLHVSLSLSLSLHIYIHTYIWPHGLTRFEGSCARADGKICKSVGRARGPIDAGGWQSFAHGAWCSRGSAGETIVLLFVGQSRVTRRRPRTRPTVCGVACHQYVMCECTHLQSWGAPARWSRARGT